MKRVLSLCALAALAGCGSLAPPMETPTPPLRTDFRTTAAAATTATEAAPNAWDDFFTDPRLRQVVALALTGNRSLQASLAAVERARAQYGISAAADNPQVNASTGVSRQQGSGNSGSTEGTRYTVSLGLAAWEIDLFDRLGSLEGAALARYLAQTQTQESARLALVADTAGAWLALASARQRQQLAEMLRDSQQRTLGLTEIRYERGVASGLERARARAAFEATRGEARSSAAAADRARLALELLAGQPLPDALLPTAQPATSTVLPAVPAGLPATVLLQRPDLRAAEQALQAANFDVGAARAARFPRLTLTASAGRRSPELDGLLGGSGTGFWSIVPTLDLPLFDGGARQAQVQASEATRREAIAQYEATLQAAFRDVADALAVRDSLAERLDAQQAQVDAAQRSAQLAERSYQLGGASQLELLDAQRQLATARQGQVALRELEQANRVALLRALGGRWGTGG